MFYKSIINAVAVAVAVTMVMFVGCGGDDDDGGEEKHSVKKETFTDSRDGKSYSSVKIGTQTWMAENLNYNASGSVCYDGSADSCAKYGRLYNWATAMDIAERYNWAEPYKSDVNHQGACPSGWHLPTDAEWTALTNFVGSNAGTKLKSSTGWRSSSSVPAGTDQYGFSALPGGYGTSRGDFNDVGSIGYWWSDTDNSGNFARARRMIYFLEYVYGIDELKTKLFSVRCVQN